MSSTEQEAETRGTVERVADTVLNAGDSEPEGAHLVYRRYPRVLAYTILTLGIYGVYWLYSVNSQLKLEYDEDYSPFWRTVSLVIPIYDILVLWRISNTQAEHVVEDQTGPILFLLWIVFFPVAMYLVQNGINQKAASRPQ